MLCRNHLLGFVNYVLFEHLFIDLLLVPSTLQFSIVFLETKTKHSFEVFAIFFEDAAGSYKNCLYSENNSSFAFPILFQTLGGRCFVSQCSLVTFWTLQIVKRRCTQISLFLP